MADGGTSGQVPQAPSGLTATAQGPTSVQLMWVPGEGEATSFEVQRATAAQGPYSSRATLPSTASGYLDEGLSTGTTYWYQVRAHGTRGASPWSAAVSATPSPVPSSAPPSPTGLAVLASGATGMIVTWTLAAGAGVEVERSLAATGPFVRVFSSAQGAVRFDDTGLSPATPYWYRVRAVNATGASEFTSTVSATTGAPAAPATPTGLAAVQEVMDSTSVVRVTWTDAATTESGYELRRSQDGTSWDSARLLPAGASSYVDASPFFGTNHYQVRAVNAGGASAAVSVSVYAGAILIGYICPAPTAISATATSETAVRLNWTYSSVPQCGTVAVERALAPEGPFIEIARVSYFLVYPPLPLDSGLLDDTGLSPGTRYHYRLRSVGTASGYTGSAPSPLVAVDTPNALQAPAGLSVTVTSATTATFAWLASSTPGDAYSVELATSQAGPFSEAFQMTGSTTQAYVQGLTASTAYWVRLRTVKGTVRSAPSNVVAFTTATSSGPLRAIADATVMESTAKRSNQTVNLSTGPNSVGCFFTWTTDTSGAIYLFHNCAGSALRFNTQALAGRTVLAARLSLTPCSLAPGPVNDATYAVFALASGWNPTTVTFNTLPQIYVDGGWAVPAPTSGQPSVFDVTTIVRNWASGAWVNNGLFVQQYPVVDRLPKINGTIYDFQDQTTTYCSTEQTGGSADWIPTLFVDYL